VHEPPCSLHLGTIVYVEPEVVVVERGTRSLHVLHPLDLLERRELAQRERGQVGVPEEILAAQAVGQDVHHAHGHQPPCSSRGRGISNVCGPEGHIFLLPGAPGASVRSCRSEIHLPIHIRQHPVQIGSTAPP
jgi:hypothetical protein